jgi:hypothetical protein
MGKKKNGQDPNFLKKGFVEFRSNNGHCFIVLPDKLMEAELPEILKILSVKPKYHFFRRQYGVLAYDNRPAAINSFLEIGETFKLKLKNVTDLNLNIKPGHLIA